MRSLLIANLLAFGCVANPCANTMDPWMCEATLAEEWPNPPEPCPGCDAPPWPDCTGPACQHS